VTTQANPLEDELLPRAALRELLAQLAGRIGCKWLGDDAPMLGQSGGPVAAWLELDVLSVRQFGTDEYRSWPNTNNALATEQAIVGWRSVTITIRAKSFNKALQAYTLLERVRRGLQSRTAAAVYAATNTAHVRTHPITVMRVKDGHRTRLDAVMDWEMAFVSHSIPNDDPGVTIGTVNAPSGLIGITFPNEGPSE
jgi:hypothetical protein